jgi:hypothetical protein
VEQREVRLAVVPHLDGQLGGRGALTFAQLARAHAR